MSTRTYRLRMASPITNCPDCNGPLGEITLLDSTGKEVGGLESSYIPLTYTTPDSSKHWLTADFAKSGLVRSMACSDCGRIFLYTQPKR